MSEASKFLAVQAARRARLLLNHTKGWKVHAFFNGGWHWALYNGPISLRVSDDHTFWAMIARRVEDQGNGCGEWTDTFHHHNPNKVLAHAIAGARACCEEYVKLDQFLAGVRP